MEPNVAPEDLPAYPVDAKECENRVSTEVRYVLTQKGGQALLYCGYCFYKVRDGENRKTFWRCSKYRTESCEVRVTTQEDRVVSIRGEHNHTPEHDPDRKHATSESQLVSHSSRARPTACLQVHQCVGKHRVRAGMSSVVLVAAAALESLAECFDYLCCCLQTVLVCLPPHLLTTTCVAYLPVFVIIVVLGYQHQSDATYKCVDIMVHLTLQQVDQLKLYHLYVCVVSSRLFTAAVFVVPI